MSGAKQGRCSTSEFENHSSSPLTCSHPVRRVCDILRQGRKPLLERILQQPDNPWVYHTKHLHALDLDVSTDNRESSDTTDFVFFRSHKQDWALVLAEHLILGQAVSTSMLTDGEIITVAR